MLGRAGSYAAASKLHKPPPSALGYTAPDMLPVASPAAWVPWLLLLAPGTPAPSWPLDPTPVRSFRSFDGQGSRLPQATVMALLQDERGVLWIATLDGAATFDGREVRPVERVPGAPAYGALSSLAPRRG